MDQSENQPMIDGGAQSKALEPVVHPNPGSGALFVLVFSGLVLGLGWAIRGVFGHEWGAAWAGSMGCLAVVVAVNREDWLRRAPLLASLGAIGWGVGGMMSYGIVIGYCRGIEFGNVAYGYAMLTVIGGLYGFIGGGLFGLGLESGGEKKTAWPSLLTEMFVCGYLTYVLLVDFMELQMTPPRSDNWARCLGAAMALTWFLHRGGFHRALRVASYAALGAGVGFSFGNSLQTLGAVLEIPVNMWNVMEFTLGFGGGVGMAYAVATREWPESCPPSKRLNWLALFGFAILLPLANRRAAFSVEHFKSVADRLNIADAERFVSTQMMTATVTVLVISSIVILFWWYSQRKASAAIGITVPILLFIHSLHYASLGATKSCIFFSSFELTNTRLWYFPILLGITTMWIVWGRKYYHLPATSTVKESEKRWGGILLGVIALIVLLVLISINTHDAPLPGTQERF